MNGIAGFVDSALETDNLVCQPRVRWERESVTRRMVLNTSKSLVLFVVASLALAAPAAAAGPAVGLLVAASAVGESAPAKAAGDRKEVEGLLLRARQA